MKILKELISLHGKGKSTCSPEVSLVNHLASLDNERERMITVISGRKCLESYERQDRSGLLARMLLESPIWFNPVVKLTWKRKVIKMKKITRKRYLSKNISSIPSATILNVKDIPSNRSLFQLAVSEPRTGETGYGLLPAPRAMEIVEHPMKAAERLKDRTGKKLNNLSSGAAFGLLPTPTAQEGFNSGKGEIFVTRNNTIRIRNQNGTSSRLGLEGAVKHMLYPTPTMRDYQPSVSPTGLVQQNGGKTSRLNPLFVEEMMGYPLMWTTLPFLTGNGEKNQ